MSTQKKKGFIQKAREKIANKINPTNPMERIDNANVIFKEHGLIPVLNIRDLEQRRQEIGKILLEIEGKTFSGDMQKIVVEKTFRMFFLSGSAWVRGLDNPELSRAVSSFLNMYKRIGHLEHSPKHLFANAMKLLHYSFNALDVTNTPVYMMHVMQPPPAYNPMLPTSGGETSQTYQVRKPQGGPYDETIPNKIE
jgi:hypothetical protein